MREPLSSLMKVGIVHPMAYPEATCCDGLMVRTIQRIAEDEFFGAIEITHVPDATTRSRVRRILETSGLAVVYGAQPVILGEGLDLNHQSGEARRKAIGRLRDCVDEAYELGAARLVLLSGKHPGGAGVKGEAIDRLLDSLTEVCSHASAQGHLEIVLEQFDCDIDKKALVGHVADAKHVAFAMRNEFPSFGILVDHGHLPLIGESIQLTLQSLRECLTHIHIGNCVLKDTTHPAYGDKHPRFGICGGEIEIEDLSRFLQLLLEVGYLGRRHAQPPIVSFEVKPLPGEDPELVIANAKRALIEAWAQVYVG